MTDRPNVVFIVADTFRRDHLGAYGNPYIHTPYLNEFARSSVVFDHHVVSSFPTMPARADILTGTFSYTHMGGEPLPRHLLSLPEVLSKAGYLTVGGVAPPSSYATASATTVASTASSGSAGRATMPDHTSVPTHGGRGGARKASKRTKGAC